MKAHDINSPQSQKLTDGSKVKMYVIAATAKQSQPKMLLILLYCIAFQEIENVICEVYNWFIVYGSGVSRGCSVVGAGVSFFSNDIFDAGT